MQKKYCFMSETGRRDTARSVKLDRPRPYPRTPRRTATRFLQSGLMVCLLALAGCDLFSEPYAYFLFDFEAEVEGETYAFTSKVECKRRWRHYALDRKSFGKRLKSGKGIYVGAPDLCRSRLANQESGHPNWVVLENNTPIVPIIYLTRSFETPWETRVFFHPEGPPPGALVRLIRATVTPLTVEEAKKHEIVPAGPNDPMGIYWKGDDAYRANKDRPVVGDILIKIESEQVSESEIKNTIQEGNISHIFLKDNKEKWKNYRDQNSFLSSILSTYQFPSHAIKEINREFGERKILRRQKIIKNLSNVWPVGLKVKDNCRFEIMHGINNSGQIIFYSPTLVNHSLTGKKQGFPKECMKEIVGFGNVISRINSDYIRKGSDFFVFKRRTFAW